MSDYSPTSSASNYISNIKREEGQSIEDYAGILFFFYMEALSAHAMTDLTVPFETLSDEVRQGWIERAKRQSEE